MSARPASRGAPAAPIPPLVWALAALALVAWIATLGYRDLIHPDEGRYAEIAREMVASGDWVSPRLNGLLYFEKPALQYWATAIGFELFGANAFAARLWPGLTSAAAVLALWLVAHARLGARAGAIAACALGGSVWWIANGHFLNLDMGLAFFTTLALLGFWHAQRDGASPGQTRAGMWVAWGAIACAVLSKGLIGALLPGAVLAIWSVLARDLGVWRRMHWGSGLAIFFAIAAPWFVVVSARNPDFARFFFVHEHFERFLTTQHRRVGAWWYFVPVLALGAMPWTTLLPGALARALRREPGRFQLNRLMLVWAVFVFAFFSASGSKLPSYILPMFPALAVLLARHVDAMPPAHLSWHAGASAALALAGVAALLVLPDPMARGSSAPRELELAYRDWIVAGLATVAAGALVAVFAARRGAALAAVAALAFASLAGTQVVMLGHQTLAPLKSARVMVESLRGRIDPSAPFYSVGTYDQSLPFYLGRPVTLVAWVDEFATGIRIEPRRQVPTFDAFERLWRAQPGAAALMAREGYERFERAGLPMRVVYRDMHRVVVVRP